VLPWGFYSPDGSGSLARNKTPMSYIGKSIDRW